MDQAAPRHTIVRRMPPSEQVCHAGTYLGKRVRPWLDPQASGKVPSKKQPWRQLL